jgi:acetolactate synthase-1/2/3 large subunit
VQYIFCYPVNTLIEACADAGIRPIVCRQERVGMGMADGFSRISNTRPVGVFTMQHGPGAENAFSGVATAFSDSTPVLVFPFGEAMSRFGIRPGFSAARAFEPISKSIELMTSADRVSDVMRRAFTALRMGRPGPVLVEVPDDVGAEELDPAQLVYEPVRPARTAADPDDVDRAAAALLGAHCPVIFAGQGVTYSEATDDLVRLAELLQAPVMTTLLGKGAFPESHPMAAGTAAGVKTGAAAHFLNKSDVVLALGTSLTRHGISSATVPPGKVIIHATNDPRDVNKDYTVTHAIIGDAKLVIRQLIEALTERLGGKSRDGNGTVAAEIKSVNEQWLQSWMPKLTSDEVPINPYRVVWEVIKAVNPTNAILTHDSGSPRSQLVPFYRTAPKGYLGFGKSHALGCGLGLIFGAKLAAPDKLCINWMGDGAFGMVGTDFETAARNNVPTLTLVSNNFEMAVETARMTHSHGRFQTRATTGRYADMATAMGGYAERIEEPGDVGPAIERAKRATQEGRTALLEFITSAETATSSGALHGAG